ncbi:MAG TPA: choice-of-anchor R domain-containing protein [Thermoplasmata archaeon]|nr:choice-of-anchor R domain-containing protein [Thermoplasmata archaeon]
MTHRMGVAAPASAVLLLVVLTLLGAGASASLYHAFDGVGDPPPNYPSGGSGVAIFSDAWAAQSFRASANYTLVRVDLWARATTFANGSATLEVRADGAGAPNMNAAPLASATTSAPAAYGWVRFNVAPSVALTQGGTYWIVLESNASSAGRGWTWWNTGSDAAVVPGVGLVTSDDDSPWRAAGGDFAVRTFGYAEARMQIGLSVDRSGVAAGGVVTYSIFFNNTGGGPAVQVWVDDALPAGLTYLSDNATASNGLRWAGTRWNFTNVDPGVHYFLLRATVDAGVANQSLLVNRVSLGYTDFHGTVMANSTAAVTLTVTAMPVGAGENGGLLGYLAFFAVVVGIFAAALRPRGRLEQVFLVDNGGTLVAHLSRVADGGIDRDIFVGMLTAIQSFVRDSFTAAQEGELRRLDFGSRKICLRRGSHTYLVAVLQGPISPTLGWKMGRTLARIETTYGEVLAAWTGDVQLVEGATEMLSAGLLH